MAKTSEIKGARWYPTQSQLVGESNLERAFRQVLKQQYELQDRYAALASDHVELQSKHSALAEKMNKTPPAGSGPTDTQICGLRVAPVDTVSLADGATLKYVKAQGNFQFS